MPPSVRRLLARFSLQALRRSPRADSVSPREAEENHWAHLFHRLLTLLRNVAHKGFFHLLSANLVTRFLGFGSQLLVIKFLTPLEMGEIKTIQSLTVVVAILAGFGFNTAVLKLCSEKRPAAQRAFIFVKAFHYTALPVSLVMIGFFFAARLKLLSPDQTVNQWLPVYMLTIAATSYTSLTMVYLQALKRIQLMATMQACIRLFGVLALIAATYLFGFPGYIISTVVIAFVALVPLLNLVKDSSRERMAVDRVFAHCFYYARWSVAANLLGSLGRYLDIFLLNFLVSDRVAFGYYGIATIFIQGLDHVTATVQAIATPYFSEKSNDREEFLRVLRKYQRLMIALAFGISVVASIAVPLLIQLVYGDEYAPAGTYFRVLVIRYFFWSCYALLGIAVLGLGQMRFNFAAAAISLPISLALTYFCITRYGIIGAAVGQGISYLIQLAVYALMTRHAIRIHFGRGHRAV